MVGPSGGLCRFISLSVTARLVSGYPSALWVFDLLGKLESINGLQVLVSACFQPATSQPVLRLLLAEASLFRFQEAFRLSLHSPYLQIKFKSRVSVSNTTSPYPRTGQGLVRETDLLRMAVPLNQLVCFDFHFLIVGQRKRVSCGLSSCVSALV